MIRSLFLPSLLAATILLLAGCCPEGVFQSDDHSGMDLRDRSLVGNEHQDPWGDVEPGDFDVVFFHETFDNRPTTTHVYVDNTFEGTVSGVTWSYVHARDEGDFAIDGPGVMLRRGDEGSSLRATIPGGIHEIWIDVRKAFSGSNDRYLEMLIDGQLVETFGPEFGYSGEDDTVLRFDSTTPLFASGDVELEIRIPPSMAGNRQIVLDNIVWTPYSQCGEDEPCSSDVWGAQCTDGMCHVPYGPFMMGCNEDVDDECAATELPYHEVFVPSFFIDENQVTVGSYQGCVNAGACTSPSSYCTANRSEDHPVTCVDWDQARAYCAWMGKRLCTEAEWEKAARGLDGNKYPWGNEPVTCEHAVFNEEGVAAGRGCGTGTTSSIGSRPDGASPYGVLDMLGNVFDWVEDDWFDSYEQTLADGSARIDPARGYDKVARGGAYFSRSNILRASHRSGLERHLGDETSGIRCCRSN